MDRQYSQNNTMEHPEKVRHILIIEDPSFKRTVSLDSATYSLGRHSSNDIVFSCQKTSRNHATLLRRTDVNTNNYSYWILDGDLQGNRSRNGIYINGKKTLVHELKHGDVVKFSGDAQARYEITSNLPDLIDEPNNIASPENTNESNQISNQINYQISNQKTALNKNTLTPDSLQPTQNSNNLESLRIAALAELIPQPIIELDLEGRITYANPAAIINFKNIYHQKLNHPLLIDLLDLCRAQSSNILAREVTANNRTFQQTIQYLPEKEVIRTYILDITKQKKLERQIQDKVALSKKILGQITEGVIIVDGATKQIVEANQACSVILGYSVEQLLKMTVYELSFEAEKFAIILQKIVTEKNNFSGLSLLRHQNGSVANINITIDLVESVEKSVEKENICIVLHKSNSNSHFSVDSLAIDLTQKDIFQKQLEIAIANAKRSQKLFSVMFLSIKLLPNIQDTIGSENSRELLSNMVERLKSCLRYGDSVTHWKDDKFALLMPEISCIEEAAKISQRIQKSLEKSFKVKENQFTVQSNIGIAIYPQDGLEIDSLLKNANLALDRTIKNNSNYQFYSSTMNSQAAVMLELENLLHHAIENNEFKLYYQPQINVNDGNIQGIEALLRWEHSELGLVSPNSFIKLAEKTGLIVPIGEWTIKTACHQNKIWQSQGLPPLRISVNLSTVQFEQPNLPSTIKQILDETQLEANLLELEISAGTLLENIEYGRHVLHQLKDLGVYISINDFASGFSSLEHLKQFPFNTLKIDRSFVQELTNDPQDLAIVSALVELGKGFNLRVVAEGVETQQQIELLRSLNCEQMQGFWFSRPLAAEEATKLLPLSYEDRE